MRFVAIIKIFTLLCMTSIMSCSSAGAEKSTEQSPAQAVAQPVENIATPNVMFNPDTAMAYLKRQVDFGPRVPGTSAHNATAAWLAQRLREMGGTVTDRIQTSIHPVSGKSIPVRNIFAQFNPEANRRFLVLAHYDTRPWADNDPDQNNHNKPIDGANDGASGVAVALELARHNASLPSDIGLDILLVDQEDSGQHDNDASWCIGSRLWASQLPYTSANMPQFGILLDMVGGRDAVFMREYFSEQYAPSINNKVWEAAKRTGNQSRFLNRIGGAINDDHISLLQAGIPTVDIIEMSPDGFNPTWHTLNDNYENIDPATIAAVGDVITFLIYSQK